MVKFTMGSSGSCGRSFRFALTPTKFTKDYIQTAQTRIIQRITGTIAVDIPQTAVAVEDDEFELTSKAIGGYNQGPGSFINTGLSWASMLKEHSKASTSDNDDIKAMRAAIGYALAVRKIAVFDHRNYMWKVTEQRAPIVSDPWQATSFYYCFIFGEDNWNVNRFDNNPDRSTKRQMSLNSQGTTTSCP